MGLARSCGRRVASTNAVSTPAASFARDSTASHHGFSFTGCSVGACPDPLSCAARGRRIPSPRSSRNWRLAWHSRISSAWCPSRQPQVSPALHLISVGEGQSIPSLRFRNNAVLALLDTPAAGRSPAPHRWLKIRCTNWLFCKRPLPICRPSEPGRRRSSTTRDMSGERCVAGPPLCKSGFCRSSHCDTRFGVGHRRLGE